MKNNKAKSLIETFGNIMRESCDLIINSPLWETDNEWTVGINENIKIKKRTDVYE